MMATGMNIADVKAALKSREPRGEKSEQAAERNSLSGCEENTENITRQGLQKLTSGQIKLGRQIKIRQINHKVETN